jgi:hypothetical protein
LALSGNPKTKHDSAMANVHSVPDWKALYEAALLETDRDKLPARIMSARSAIFDRIEESVTNPLAVEQSAMDNALRNLRHLAELASEPKAA